MNTGDDVPQLAAPRRSDGLVLACYVEAFKTADLVRLSQSEISALSDVIVPRSVQFST